MFLRTPSMFRRFLHADYSTSTSVLSCYRVARGSSRGHWLTTGCDVLPRAAVSVLPIKGSPGAPVAATGAGLGLISKQELHGTMGKYLVISMEMADLELIMMNHCELLWIIWVYPLVNCYRKLRKFTIFNGKTHEH